MEDEIRSRVSLSGPDTRGFYNLKCLCCNDYKIRAGFKFDGNIIGFNCWNCGTTGRYEEFSGKISKNFRKILNCHGVSNEDIDKIINSSFFTNKAEDDKKITLDKLTQVNLNTPTVKLPPKSFKLGSTEEFTGYQQKIVDYLVSRKIDIFKYNFFFSLDERYLNKVIIPFYRNGKMIYWQARSIMPGEKSRYDNSPGSRDAIIFNYDKIHSSDFYPLIVSEGVFDAMVFDGVAIMGSKLTAAKIEILKSSKRKLLFVIDKDNNGKSLAHEALKHGWDISFLPDGIADINDGAQKIGKAATAFYIRKNIPADYDHALMLLNLYCKGT